jgi:transcriptional regulator with XRE-family HTH domain
MPHLTSFGREITKAREKKEMTQRQLAGEVRREDGETISPQYLNDIERDRRVPSGEVIRGLAAALGLDSDYLHYLAKKWPDDLAEASLEPSQVRDLMFAFRKFHQ